MHSSQVPFPPLCRFGRLYATKYFRRQILDLQTVDPGVGGFFGGFAWEGYGYLVPCRSFQVRLIVPPRQERIQRR